MDADDDASSFWVTVSLVPLAAMLLFLVVRTVLPLVAMVVDDISSTQRRGSPPLMPIQQLLDSIPDVPYQQSPGVDAADDAGGGSTDCCGICLDAYVHGERCSVMPNCIHVFHKGCLAKWLRNSRTCPLCRALVTG
ncbi:hypothetical protein ACP70R_009034 [Stipagrostis hirtigluma subsp. patula]